MKMSEILPGHVRCHPPPLPSLNRGIDEHRCFSRVREGGSNRMNSEKEASSGEDLEFDTETE